MIHPLTDFGTNYVTAWVLEMENLLRDVLAPFALAERAKGLAVSHKEGPADIVTQVDREIERRLVSYHETHFPGLLVLGEELNPSGDRNGRHVRIDPIDGTINFADGSPNFTNCVSLMKGDLVRAVVICQPVGSRIWRYENDFRRRKLHRGKTLQSEPRQNGEHGRVFRTLDGKKRWARTLAEATVEISVTGRTEEDAVFNVRMLDRLTRRVRGIHATGCSTLVCPQVADGILDASIIHHHGVWDMQPSRAMVEAAGGLTLNLQGLPWKSGDLPMILTSPFIRDELLAALNSP